MMRYIYLIILGLFFSVINMEANNSASISLVPCPTNVVPGTGSFQFTPKTVFAVETEEQAAIVRLLSDQFTCAAGFTPKLKVDSKKGNLVLQTDKTINRQGSRCQRFLLCSAEYPPAIAAGNRKCGQSGWYGMDSAGNDHYR